MGTVAVIDVKNLQMIRANIRSFVADCAEKYDRPDALMLDIAPQDHEGAAPLFKCARIETLDISRESGATYIADITQNNSHTIPDGHFDFVVCTDVLEHTLQPFDAVREILRITKPGGMIFVSVPFNFRIHGPLPDCWRFTEHGLRALFRDTDIVELKGLEDPERFLMPIHYTLTARKKY